MYKRMMRWLDGVPIDDPLQRRQAGIFQIVLIIWIGLAALGSATIVWNDRAAQRAGPLPAAIVVGLPLVLSALVLLVVCPCVALAL